MTPEQHVAAAETLVRDLIDGVDAPVAVIVEAAAHLGMAQTAARVPEGAR